jgi:hypothetical protein
MNAPTVKATFCGLLSPGRTSVVVEMLQVKFLGRVPQARVAVPL